tara:strand:+ start:17 stop:757 length:741 start_codon:yes stop_codon:yes gene_type:complete
MTTALIDGDLICYISAVSANDADERFATSRSEKMLGRILEEVGCDDYRVFLSGGSNFRKKLNPEYKAQRPPPPEHLKACRQLMIDRHNAEVTEGYEADDALGIAQTKDTVICSIDKDLLMIEGKHYSWDIVRKGKVVRPAMFREVGYHEGIIHFFKQMLIGDVADNLFGIRGIGEAKASKLLQEVPDEDLLRTIVLNMYIDDAVGGVQDLPEEEKAATDRFYMNADCFWIWRDLGVTYSVREDIEG